MLLRLAAIDFMPSKGELYFIEANSAPGLMLDLKDLPIKIASALSELVKRKVDEEAKVCVLSTFDSSREIMKRKEEIFRRFGLRAYSCYLEEQKELRKGVFRDYKGKRFEADAVIFNRLISAQLLPQEIYQINPLEGILVCSDKFLSYLAVKNARSFKVPATYLITDHSTALLFENLNYGEAVLKPLFGKFGIGVRFVKNPEEVNEPLIFQEVVEQEEARDIRLYFVDGKFVGAVERRSKTRLTNIHAGGVSAEIEVSRKIVRAGEEALRLLESFASSLKARP